MNLSWNKRDKRNLIWLAAAVLAIIINSSLTPATAAPLSGTRTIGLTGDYASITAAIADIQTQTLGGALVLELQSNYVCSVETFPLTFSNLTTTAANTLTLRPQPGATNLLISSAVTTTATVDLNGAQFLTIDGRPGGVGGNTGSGGGATAQLTIANTSTSGRALRFINEASGNTLRYVTLRGVNTSTSSGVVVFSTTTGANGNDNNTIDHCDIRDGSSTPDNCIYSSGAAAPKDNSGNSVSNCNIYNFFTTTGDQYGIRLDGGNTDWTVTGNSFYQTVNRSGPSYSGTTAGGIFINNPAGNNFVVCSNAIGGSAPNAAPLQWAITGTATSTRFIGISLNVGSSMPSSMQGNIIQNFYWLSALNTATAPGIWGGIAVSAGSANIGTVTGNVIGSGGAVTVITSGSGGLSTGFSSTSSNTVVIANNSISSFGVNGSSTLVNASFTGIQVTAGVNVISNNVVGTTLGGPIQAATASTSTIGPQQVTGILSSSSNSASITGNLVVGLFNNYANIFTGQVRGIMTSDGKNTITGNTVSGLYTTSGDANGDTSTSVLGICDTSAVEGQTVSQNQVENLVNTVITSPITVTGIYFGGPTNGNNVIAQNSVNGLAISSTNGASLLVGMFFRGGVFTAQNNIVRVGLTRQGQNTAGASLVFGIEDLGADDGRNFYHNSVYLGGTQNSSSHDTCALVSTGSGNARTYQNNIFVNARSKSGGTYKPYAVSYRGTDLTGLTAGGNIFRASGTGGVLGRYNSTDYNTLAAWQAATGQDASSQAADPLFLAPSGSSMDLHIATDSPAINAGLPIGVTDDFDGQLRSLTTPTIGADEYHAPGYNQLSAQSLGSGSGSGTNLLAFLGVSGLNYALEMATNLVPPVLWQPQLTNSGATDGWLFFTNATSQSPVFYRTRYVP